MSKSAWIAATFSLAACGPAAQQDTPAPTVEGDAAATASDAAADVHVQKPIDPGCTAPPEVSSTPGTVEDTVTLINALKAQQEGALTLSCFLQSLSRPFPALATKSVFSAQPARGARNPRFFIFSDQLVMSVVPIGDGRPLLELAAYTTATRSVKAEILFPIEAPLAYDTPYERIRYGEKTLCGACHANEERVDGVVGADRFESAVLRPRPSEIVKLDYVRNESETCDPSIDPERCDILSAIFAHGELTQGAFSTDAHTIFDQ